MIKELNVTAPLRKEMAELTAKLQSLPFGCAEWTAINLRWNMLLALWSTSRIESMVEDLGKVRVQ